MTNRHQPDNFNTLFNDYYFPIFTTLIIFLGIIVWLIGAAGYTHTELDLDELAQSHEGLVQRIGQGRVKDIAYSPDGNVLGVATYSGISFYDASTYELMWFWATEGSTNSLAWSPDSQTLIIEASGDIFQISLVSQSVNLIKTPHSFVLAEIKWSPNGRYIAFGKGLSRNEIWLWDTHNQRWSTPIRNSGRIPFMGGFSWSPDSQSIAHGYSHGPLGEQETVIRVWNISDGGVLENSWPSLEFDDVIDWHPNGDRLLLSGRGFSGRGLHVLDITNGNIAPHVDHFNSRRTISMDNGYTITLPNGFESTKISGFPHLNWLLRVDNTVDTDQIQWRPNYNQIAGVSRFDNIISVWDLDTGELHIQIDLEAHWADDLAWSPDGSQVAVLGRDGFVRLYDRSSLEEMAVLGEGRSTLFKQEINWSDDNQWLAWTAPLEHGSERFLFMHVWSVDGQFHSLIPGSEAQWVPNQNRLAFFTKQSLQIWQIKENAEPQLITEYANDLMKEWTFTPDQAPPPGINSWSFSPDSQYIAAVVQHSKGDQAPYINSTELVILQVAEGLPVVKRTPLQGGYARQLVWNPQGDQIAISYTVDCWLRSCKKLGIWSSHSGERIADLGYQEGNGSSKLSWSPDGIWLVFSRGPSGDIMTLYDTENRKSYELKGHYGVPDWSPDGQTIVSGSADGNLVFLDIESLLSTIKSNAPQSSILR